MYSDGGGLGIRAREKNHSKIWGPDNHDHGISFRNRKCFVRCICPKCADHHNVYMLWTGRGIPRKYCCNCKPLVAGYDDVAIYEASAQTGGHAKKKGRRHEGE